MSRRAAGKTLGAPPADRPLVLGLRENWKQFSLLIIVNAFVGAMVGLERSVLPVVASREFGIASASAALSFIATFGLAKALTNLAAGWLVGHRGRRWTLIAGWLAAVPVPIVIMVAPSWSWIVAANALLGVSQGLAWSTTVIMKIDLVGPRHRGLAMGLNESAGYVAVALAAVASGYVASIVGLRAGPGYLGIAIAITGLLASVFLVRETAGYVRLEETRHPESSSASTSGTIRQLLARSLWSDAGLFSVSQAGLVNNLNDGLAWGLFPLLFTSAGLSVRHTGLLAAIYPATWGICQIATGSLSDRWGRKPFIVAGMVLQGFSLIAMTLWQGLFPWVVALAASESAQRWSTPRCSRPSAISFGRRRVERRSASIACGAISGTWWARLQPARWQTPLEWLPPSASSAR